MPTDSADVSLEDETLETRESPLRWFQGFGRWLHPETRKPTRGKANVLQRRVFEHYRRCQSEGRPCRMVVLKYRRAGSSTAGTCLTYVHGLNYVSRLAAIGTDYRASVNMLQMIRTFAQYDDFPGWTEDGKQPGVKDGKKQRVTQAEWSKDEFPYSDFEGKVAKNIATELIFRHGSSVELYTSENPESARSAGLNGYIATECGRWQTGGVKDAAETLSSMRNTLPKSGFHLAIEESTANGAQGAFYETCRTARWPEYAEWANQFKRRWPLDEVRFGKDLQFVLIFAAWFEDERHVPTDPITQDDIDHIKATLDDDERELIAQYQQDGPRGPRLGGEVNATTWEQLAWRRGIIATVCTKGGVDEFRQEYPSNVPESFRASGSPALDQDGVMALEDMARKSAAPLFCSIDVLGKHTVVAPNAADWLVWELPIPGCRYLIAGDAMSGAELVTSPGVKDNHSVLVLRDAYTDANGEYHHPMVAARMKPPCQLENDVVASQVARASLMYGGAIIAFEATSGGVAILVLLNREYNAPLYLREITDSAGTDVTSRIGWVTGETSRRVAITALQQAVREQEIEVRCTHITAELASLIINSKGKVIAGGSAHDDDAITLAIGIVLLPYATRFEPVREKIKREADDTRSWKAMN